MGLGNLSQIGLFGPSDAAVKHNIVVGFPQSFSSSFRCCTAAESTCEELNFYSNARKIIIKAELLLKVGHLLKSLINF